jgi:hypothetical protein
VRGELLRFADFLHLFGNREPVKLGVANPAKVETRGEDCLLDWQQ